MELKQIEASDVSAWRLWLKKNHLTANGIWLVFYRKNSGHSSLTYDEALNEALAYGWIDSLVRKIDDQRFARKFTPRRPGSIWSKPNISRVNQLTKADRMTKWGFDAFSKRTDKISLLEKVNSEGFIMPPDFEEALRDNPKALDNFRKFTSSYRKRYFMWITAAKRPETRRKRVNESIILISRNVKALLK